MDNKNNMSTGDKLQIAAAILFSVAGIVWAILLLTHVIPLNDITVVVSWIVLILSIASIHILLWATGFIPFGLKNIFLALVLTPGIPALIIWIASM